MLRRGLLRDYADVLSTAARVGDIGMIVAVGLVAHRLILNSWRPGAIADLTLVLGAALTLLVFDHLAMYRAWRGVRLKDQASALMRSWGIVAIATVAFSQLATGDAHLPIGWFLVWSVGCCGALVCSRVVARVALRQARAAGYNLRSVVFVGLSPVGVRVIQRLRGSRWLGFRVLGYFDDRSVQRSSRGARHLPRLGSVEELASYVERERIDQVWIDYPLIGAHRADMVVRALRHQSAEIRMLLDIFDFQLLNHSVSEVAGVPVLNMTDGPIKGFGGMAKDVMDRVLALIALGLLAPLMIAIAIGVKLSSPGPILFRQTRLTLNNRPFTMFKFRSMPTEVKDDVWDSGVKPTTAFGDFIRRYSLDELPQLFNVLRGEMSLVGPRPERVVHIERLKEEYPGYMKKHMVKGGMTGWAQVNGWRGDTCLRRRIEHDLHYINNWSVWLDLRIMALTLVRGLRPPAPPDVPRHQETVR